VFDSSAIPLLCVSIQFEVYSLCCLYKYVCIIGEERRLSSVSELMELPFSENCIEISLIWNTMFAKNVPSWICCTMALCT
jgi:hypothetical protein